MSKKSKKHFLELTHQLSLNKLKKVIQSDFKSRFRRVKTQYITVSGANNYGALQHKYRGENYFTKISANNSNSKKEVYFYTTILEKEKNLGVFTPKLIALRHIDAIQYLTIDSLRPLPKTTLSLELINLAQKIENTPITDIITQAPTTHHRKSRLKTSHHPVVLGYFYRDIHLANTHEFLLHSFLKLGEKNQYPNEVLLIINKIKNTLLKKKLYTHVNPNTTYRFQHGDFKQKNLGLDYKTNKLKVFDWANYNIGPRFLDVLLFSVDSQTPYKQLKDLYLYNSTIAQPLSPIERLFASKAYIFMNYITLLKKPQSAIINDYIYPAFEDFIILSAEFS